MPTYATYEEVRRSQSSSAPFLVGAFLCAATLTTSPQPTNATETRPAAQIEAISRNSLVQEGDKLIQRILDISQQPELRDEDEPAPTQQVIEQAIHLIRDADNLMVEMPSGQVSVFFGEVNVTWRAGDRIVRLACFPNRPSVIQTGYLSLPLGSYRSEPNPTAQLLAARLEALVPDDNDPEEPLFLG